MITYKASTRKDTYKSSTFYFPIILMDGEPIELSDPKTTRKKAYYAAEKLIKELKSNTDPLL